MHLVPTLSPSESVEQSVEFRFAKAGTRSVPATLGAFFFDVIPIAASLGIQGEFNQTQNHHQVSDRLGLVERSGEGPEFDSVLSACQVGQIQKVVAVRFASGLGVVFIAVLFDPFGVGDLFAFAATGRSVDRSFVVADQRNQPCEGGGVSVPGNRYVQTAARANPSAASVDLVDRVFYLSYTVGPFEYRAYKLATFAASVLGSNTTVAFCFPSGWQPRYLGTAVVGSDRCVVGAWEGGFEFNSESDLVCVHRVVPVWLKLCFATRRLRCDNTHGAILFEEPQANFCMFFPVIHMFFKKPRVPQHYATVASKHVPHNQANMHAKRHGARTVAPRFEMANIGGMR